MYISFRLKFATTIQGEELRIVGNIPEFGLWDVGFFGRSGLLPKKIVFTLINPFMKLNSLLLAILSLIFPQTPITTYNFSYSFPLIQAQKSTIMTTSEYKYPEWKTQAILFFENTP